VVWLASAPVFLAVAEALLVLAAVEYAGLARASGSPIPTLAATAAAALAAAAFSGAVLGTATPLPVHLVLMSALVALGGLTVANWRGGTSALGSAAAALMPALYLGLPIGAMVAVREAHGPAVLFLLMLTVIVSDTAQYYSGRWLGRRPLAPAISPKKTIEGAIGGFVMGGLALAIVGHWWLPFVPVPLRAALGLTVVALGITGDLFESMLKRGAGVKDSSSLIPGHGGVLDRIDALLFAAPIYYIVLTYV
jgi:phosphatidate cytidylyltransferase